MTGDDSNFRVAQASNDMRGGSNGFAARTDSFEVDLSGLLNLLVRGRWILLLAVLLGLTAGVVATVLATPTFVARSAIQIEQGDATTNGSDTPGAEAQSSNIDYARFSQTEIDVIKSRATAAEVVDRAGLLRSQPFLRVIGASSATDKGVPPRQLREQAISYLSDAVSIDLPKSTSVATIKASTPDAALSASLANAYAKAAIERDLQRKFDSSGYAREFLDHQLNRVRSRLQASEVAMNTYARNAGIVLVAGADTGAASGAGGGGQTVTITSLGQAAVAANEATAQRVRAEQTWRSAAASPIMSVPQVAGDPSVQALSQQLAAAQAKLRQDRETMGPSHPTVVGDVALTSTLTREIAAAARNALKTLQLQYDTAQRQEEGLLGQVRTLKDAALTENQAQVQYNFLKRDVETNRALYDALLQRQKNVNAQSGVNKSSISVVDEAVAPDRPSSPNLLLNASVGVVAALFCGLLVVLLREQLGQRIRTAEEIATVAGLPLLGIIPKLDSDSDVLAELDQPRSTIHEAYFAVRTNLSLATPEGMPKVLLVTSSRSGEGKTTSSLALAYSSARLGYRTLLIDADMRRPSVHTRMDVPNTVGLSGLLSRNVLEDTAVQASRFDNLSVITSGPIPPNPTELLSGDGFAHVLDWARSRFDLVVVDAPPVLALADAVLLSASVDGVMFLVESGQATRASVRNGLRRLRMVNARLLGIVLGKHTFTRLDSYNYDDYSYSEDERS